MFLEDPNIAVCNQTHLIQLISSLVETPRPEMGLSDKGDLQNVQRWGGLQECGWEALLWYSPLNEWMKQMSEFGPWVPPVMLKMASSGKMR